jgi:hypothetical protein
MPLPNLAQTAALLAGTALTAAGLNLGVLALHDPEADVTAAASDEQVDLVALPAPAVALIASAQAAPPTPVTAAVAVVAVASEQSTAAESVTDDRSTAAQSSPKRGYEDEDHGHGDDYDDDESEHEDDDSITTPTMTATTARRPTTEPPVTAAQPTSGQSASPSTVAPSTQPPATAAPPPAPTPTAAPVTEYLTYEFEGIASIIIARHDGRSLEFWSVISEPGWAYLVEDRLGSTVKIKFRPVNGGDEAEFEAKLENGRMKIKREY